jgi:hypothetical protein
VDELVHLKGRGSFERVIGRAGELMGQNRQRLTLAMFVLQAGAVFLSCGVVPEEEHSGFRERPLQISVCPLMLWHT